MEYILTTSQISFIGDVLRIVCAVINKYLINATKDGNQIIASRMLERLSRERVLQCFVKNHNLDRRSVVKWNSADHCDMYEFPKLDDVH